MRGLSLSSESSRQLPRFNRFNKDFDQVAKTGLGSSAALVTSLVGSLLCLFGVVELEEKAASAGGVTSPEKHEKPEKPEKKQHGRDLVHSLGQFCHCLAQGKIGSGFDVASAVYGSVQYRRFSPSILESLLDKV